LTQILNLSNAYIKDKGTEEGPVWHSSTSPVELFFRKQLHEQLREQGRAMVLQLHCVLNSVRESFQRS
jgi:hypothetical protein